jgi:hypothetical protein
MQCSNRKLYEFDCNIKFVVKESCSVIVKHLTNEKFWKIMSLFDIKKRNL